MENSYSAFFSCLFESIAVGTVIVSVGSYYTTYYLVYFLIFSVITIALLEWYNQKNPQYTKASKTKVALREESETIATEERILEERSKKFQRNFTRRRKTLRNMVASTKHFAAHNNNNSLNHRRFSNHSQQDLLKTIDETSLDSGKSTEKLSLTPKKTPSKVANELNPKVTLRSRIKSKWDLAREKYARRSLPPDILLMKPPIAKDVSGIFQKDIS